LTADARNCPPSVGRVWDERNGRRARRTGGRRRTPNPTSSPSGSNAGPPTPESSWSPARKSPSPAPDPSAASKPTGPARPPY